MAGWRRQLRIRYFKSRNMVSSSGLVVARESRGTRLRASAGEPRARRARSRARAPTRTARTGRRRRSSWAARSVRQPVAFDARGRARRGSSPRRCAARHCANVMRAPEQLAAAERLRRALRDDLAGGDDRDPVGEAFGLLHVVGREEDRLAEVPQAGDDLPGGAARGGVEAGRRLVEEDQLGVADQRQSRRPAAGAGRRRATLARSSACSLSPTSASVSSTWRGAG